MLLPLLRELCVTLAAARKSPLPLRDRARACPVLESGGEGEDTPNASRCLTGRALDRIDCTYYAIRSVRHPLTPTLSPGRGRNTLPLGYSCAKVSSGRKLHNFSQWRRNYTLSPEELCVTSAEAVRITPSLRKNSARLQPEVQVFLPFLGENMTQIQP